MKEVEFRGLDENRVWHYGLPSYGTNNRVSEIEVKCCGEFVEVIPETIGQYIGIKDIHGKKVFRGDIVKVERILYTDCYRKEVEDIIEFIGEVVWQGFGWAVAEKVKEGIHYHLLWLWNIDNDKNDTMEILGNRWGNPELKVIA